ncbi:MAG: ABC transporter ATP-binding protein [Candidatus Pristimantibacillus sp.]
MLLYERHRKAIEKMYAHKATISRHVKSEKGSGATKVQLSVVYENQACRLSQSGSGKNNQSPAQNDIQYELRLFIAPEIIITQGDEITVAYEGIVMTYVAGEPFRYSSHQEINLERKGYA